MQPDLIAVAFCFSMNSDVSMVFRCSGIFSEMILNHDIRCITGRPYATLSPQQRELIFKKSSKEIKENLKMFFSIKAC